MGAALEGDQRTISVAGSIGSDMWRLGDGQRIGAALRAIGSVPGDGERQQPGG